MDDLNSKMRYRASGASWKLGKERRDAALVPPCNPSNDSLLAREKGVSRVPLRLV